MVKMPKMPKVNMPKFNYGTPTMEDASAVVKWQQRGGNKADVSFNTRANQFLGTAKGNLESAAMEQGRGVMGMAGVYAAQGAGVGAVAGGAVEYAQGGSFWDGAKQGALNGAVGVGGYRLAARATGASSSPFKALSAQKSADKQVGVMGSASAMWKSTSGNRDVSGQAMAILNNRQMEGMARNVMNQRARNSR